MSKPRFVSGGVTAAGGFKAAGISCGIKKSGAMDLALIMADAPCPSAGVFTRNRVKAHPVVDAAGKLGRGGCIQGILVNSGSANACTGPEGMEDLRMVLASLSDFSGVPERNLLMSSTGVIGERLPVDNIRGGIGTIVSSLSVGGHEAAARAIMTTDTKPKEYAVTVETAGEAFTIGGMAKGAGMINPRLATMLAFLTTDALITDRRALRKALKTAADSSFNRLDLDGDTSTNDSVIILAGGGSGINPFKVSPRSFIEGLEVVCAELARKIAGDMEGAAKLVTVRVSGAVSDRQAELAARTVAESPLVKTAVHGQDPNWGRIMAALGRSGAFFNPNQVSVVINGTLLVREGRKNPAVTEAEARRALTSKEVEISIDLSRGKGNAAILTGDLSTDYIRINASYRS